MAMSLTVPKSVGLHRGAKVAQSQRWFSRALKVLAGGVSSSARNTTTGPLPHPLYMTRGQGARIWDADGNEFVDYLMSYGSVILGHVNPELTQVLKNQIDAGTMFGTCNTPEVELAEQICRMVPCAELVRFANSGSEAICGAVRAARGFTGRNKVLKFEGHYHGWVDVLAVSNRPGIEESGPLEMPTSRPHSRGIPAGVVSDVVICPWNNPQVLKNILDAHRDEIAALIAEPIVANNACIMPRPGYLQLLRDECSKRGIVLIFDEIVTGFRLGPGGAQELFDVVPDIAVFSKALGGGLPISSFAGRRKIMDLIASNAVKHGGTYNGSPLCAAAALHTLRALADPATLQRMNDSGLVLMEALRRAAADNRIDCTVQGAGGMFQIVFTPGQQTIHDYRDLAKSDAARYAAFRHALLEQGIHVNNSGFACWFPSIAHLPEDMEIAVDAIEAAMRAIA